MGEKDDVAEYIFFPITLTPAVDMMVYRPGVCRPPGDVDELPVSGRDTLPSREYVIQGTGRLFIRVRPLKSSRRRP